MDKKILSWTALCQMAHAVYKTRQQDFVDLCGKGTDRLVPGHWVSFGSGYTCFDIRRSSSPESRCILSVFGLQTKSGVLTKFSPKLTPTLYSKRFWTRYMPVSFPAGLPKRGQGSQVAVYHGPNGKTCGGSVGFTPRAGQTARFSVGSQPATGLLLFNDATGKLVHVGDSDANLDPEVLEHIRWTTYDEGTWSSFPDWRPATLSETAGLYPGACETRQEWLKSIYEAAREGLLDLEQCLPLAARMWNAAYRFCQSHADIRPVFHAYPIQKPGGVSIFDVRRISSVLKWGDTTPRGMPDGSVELLPVRAEDVSRYDLPCIVISFEALERQRVRHCNVLRASLMDRRHITMTLPPLGNHLLYDKPHYGTPDSRSQPCVSRLSGEYIYANSKPHRVKDDPSLEVRMIERAYHTLPILNPERAAALSGNLQVGSSRSFTQNRTWQDHDADETAACLKWRDYPDGVHVMSDWDEKPGNDPDGPWAMLTGEQAGFVATPEAATGAVDEALLLASMPLS